MFCRLFQTPSLIPLVFPTSATSSLQLAPVCCNGCLVLDCKTRGERKVKSNRRDNGLDDNANSQNIVEGTAVFCQFAIISVYTAAASFKCVYTTVRA